MSRRPSTAATEELVNLHNAVLAPEQWVESSPETIEKLRAVETENFFAQPVAHADPAEVLALADAIRSLAKSSTDTDKEILERRSELPSEDRSPLQVDVAKDRQQKLDSHYYPLFQASIRRVLLLRIADQLQESASLQQERPRSGATGSSTYDRSFSQSRDLVVADAEPTEVLPSASSIADCVDRTIRLARRAFSTNRSRGSLNPRVTIILPAQLIGATETADWRNHIQSIVDRSVQAYFTWTYADVDEVHVLAEYATSSASEIADLEHLEYAYSTLDEADRACLHIDSRLPESELFSAFRVVDRPPQPAICGNPGCRVALPEALPTDHLCPGKDCRRPIRSRCGNPHCTERLLHLSPNGRNETCSCGGLNKSRFWAHEHDGRKFVMEYGTAACTRCVEEHRVNPVRRTANAIAWSPEYRLGETCDGCTREIARGRAAFSTPTMIDPRLAQYRNDGVRPDEVISFKELATSLELFEGHRCPRCHSSWIPTDLRRTALQSSLPHRLHEPAFLYRIGEHEFVGHKSIDAPLSHVCHSCEYPVDRSYEMCPRCRTKLEWCTVCAGSTGRIGMRGAGPTENDGCEVCHTWLPTLGTLQWWDGRALVCTNLYGCPSGGGMLDVTQEVVHPITTTDSRSCGVCNSDDFPMIAISELDSVIDDCGFCTALLRPPKDDESPSEPVSADQAPRGHMLV